MKSLHLIFITTLIILTGACSQDVSEPNTLESGPYKLIFNVRGEKAAIDVYVTVDEGDVDIETEGSDELLYGEIDEGVLTITREDGANLVIYEGPIDNDGKVAGICRIQRNNNTLMSSEFELKPSEE